MTDLDRLVIFRRVRSAVLFLVLAGLAACSTQAPQQSALQESAQYVARAHHDYHPPGTADDPWGPYIREAAARFDIPETWIRALMHVESGGREYQNGQLITSGAGAMGLMQVMPATYDGLKARYNLGDDPFSPHDNIMAGVAYMREMYDIYGSPGFLAAYNAGPARLDDYLSNVRPLPDETRRYVAMIGPSVVGIYPNNRSAVDQYAQLTLPIHIPPGRRFSRPVMLAGASRTRGSGGRIPKRMPVEVASLPEPVRHGRESEQELALVMPPAPPPVRGFRLISSANAADASPVRRGVVSPGQWAIQIGAFNNQGQAHLALMKANEHAHVELRVAHPFVASVRQGHGLMWRARMTGMSRDTAVDACAKITHGHMSCIVLSPEAQS